MSVWRLSWLAVFFGVLTWSGINPKDFTTWVLEVMPALIAIALLFYTRNSFPLTTLAYMTGNWISCRQPIKIHTGQHHKSTSGPI